MRVAFSFDDATLPDLEIAELLLKYGFEKNTTFYFPVMPTLTNEPKNRISLNEKQMQQIAEDFEIGSHTTTHQLLTRIPIETARREIFESRDILQKRFNQPINKFSYPRGYANPEIQNLVQEAGYESARSTLVGYIHESENPFFEQTTVHIGCDRKEYGGQDWFSYALYMLGLARNTPNSVFHAWGHGFETINVMSKFEELLKEL